MPALSRIRVNDFYEEQFYLPMTCVHCADAPCVRCVRRWRSRGAGRSDPGPRAALHRLQDVPAGVPVRCDGLPPERRRGAELRSLSPLRRGRSACSSACRGLSSMPRWRRPRPRSRRSTPPRQAVSAGTARKGAATRAMQGQVRPDRQQCGALCGAIDWIRKPIRQEKIVLVNREPGPAYSRVALPYFVAGEMTLEELLIRQRPPITAATVWS